MVAIIPKPPVVLHGQDIEAMRWEHMPGEPAGVEQKVLWRSGESMTGIMRLAPDTNVDEHAHWHAHHHGWILSGSCTILGQRMTAGDYVHIPGGVDHAITDVGPSGCELFFLYLVGD